MNTRKQPPAKLVHIEDVKAELRDIINAMRADFEGFADGITADPELRQQIEAKLNAAFDRATAKASWKQ
jgi:hypothetical protein